MIFTSESVSVGHPDKMADLVSDSILDAVLTQDPNARVACETLLSAKGIALAGEISANAKVDYEAIARRAISEIDPEYEAQASFTNHIVSQSPDIAEGVADGGAGDQGMMFGYATSETDEFMPLPIALAHRIIRRLDSVNIPYLKADAKTQVTVDYSGDKPRVDTVVLSARHNAGIDLADLYIDLLTEVLAPELHGYVDGDTVAHINPAGKFVLGGPLADAGLTGRKIIVDTYGGMARHGGGAFSGKDATKVDRSGAYMARYTAKNVVAAGLADKCEIQLAYAIGVAEPVSVRVDTFSTAKADERAIERAIREVFDLTPLGIIKALDLRKPIFAKTAVGGHFGRDEFTWEKTDKINDLLEAI